MLFFRSEADVAEWKRERNVSGGEMLSLAQLWELTKIWYGNRLLYEFHGRSAEQAQEIFREVGLTNKFWFTE